ncbi:MAG: GGDEF domain-containing protein [Myxococcota bacterium]
MTPPVPPSPSEAMDDDVPLELELVRGDLARLAFVLVVATAIHAAHVAVFLPGLLAPDPGDTSRHLLWHQLLALAHGTMGVLAACAALALRHHRRVDLAWVRARRWVPGVAGLAYLVFTALLSGVDQLGAPSGTAFVVGCTGVAMILRLDLRTTIAAYTIGLATLVVVVVSLQPDDALRSSVLLNCISMAALAFILARANQRLHLQVFSDRRTIALQARRLEAMNQELRREAEERARAHAAVELAARHDSLTGVLTRRAFFEVVGRAERERDQALVLFDIDSFKAVNDDFGHAAGDRLLVDVAAAARGAVRDGDAVGRLGGDELAVLLPGADLDAALVVAERIRAAVAALTPLSGPATVSVGVVVRLPGEAVDPWVARADQAMYRAKHAGRNRVST